MGDWGIKVTNNGADVSSNTPGDYSVWSKYPNLETYIVGTCSWTISSESYSEQNHNILTLAHNLGYNPQVLLYWFVNSNMGCEWWVGSQGSPHNCWEYIEYNVDNTYLTIDYRFNTSNPPSGDSQTGLSGTTFNFKYYIFIQQGS